MCALATEQFPVTLPRTVMKPTANAFNNDERLELTHNVERYSEDVITFPLKSNWLICRNAIIFTSPMSLFPTCNIKHNHVSTNRGAVNRTPSTTQILLNCLNKKCILFYTNHMETWRLSKCKYFSSRVNSLQLKTCTLSVQDWWH